MQEKEAWSPLKLQSGNHFGILQVPVKLPPGELCQAAQRCLQQRGSRLCPRNAAVPSPPGASPAPRGTLLLGRSPNSSRARERCVGSTRRLSSSVTSPGRSCGESRGSRVSPGAGGDGKEPQECCLSCHWLRMPRASLSFLQVPAPAEGGHQGGNPGLEGTRGAQALGEAGGTLRNGHTM